MTIVEAIVSVLIAAGLMLASLEISRAVIDRTQMARLELRASMKSEELLARAGAEFPLKDMQIESGSSGPVQWSLRIQSRRYGEGPLEAFEVSARVIVLENGRKGESVLGTLKLRERRHP